MRNGTGRNLPPPFFFFPHEIAYKYKTIWKYGQHKHIQVNYCFRAVAIYDVKVNPQLLHHRFCLTISSQALMFSSGQIRVCFFFFSCCWFFSFFSFIFKFQKWLKRFDFLLLEKHSEKIVQKMTK